MTVAELSQKMILLVLLPEKRTKRATTLQPDAKFRLREGLKISTLLLTLSPNVRNKNFKKRTSNFLTVKFVYTIRTIMGKVVV